MTTKVQDRSDIRPTANVAVPAEEWREGLVALPADHVYGKTALTPEEWAAVDRRRPGRYLVVERSHDLLVPIERHEYPSLLLALDAADHAAVLCPKAFRPDTTRAMRLVVARAVQDPSGEGMAPGRGTAGAGGEPGQGCPRLPATSGIDAELDAANEHRAAVVLGLRELAQFLVDHPEAPVYRYALNVSFAAGGDGGDELAIGRARAMADALGVELERDGGHWRAHRVFAGAVRYGCTYVEHATAAEYDAARSYTGAVVPDGQLLDGAL